jgi:hypothetical protein
MLLIDRSDSMLLIDRSVDVAAVVLIDRSNWMLLIDQSMLLSLLRSIDPTQLYPSIDQPMHKTLCTIDQIGSVYYDLPYESDTMGCVCVCVCVHTIKFFLNSINKMTSCWLQIDQPWLVWIAPECRWSMAI